MRRSSLFWEFARTVRPIHIVAAPTDPGNRPVFEALVEAARRDADALARKGVRAVLSVADPDGFVAGEVPGVLVREGQGREERFWHLPRERFARELGCDADRLFCARAEDLRSVRPLLTRSSECRFLSGEAPSGFEPSDAGFSRTQRTRDAASEKPVPGRVIIVGSGLGGAFAAMALAERGIGSVVLDAGRAPASGASALYAGMFHPHWQANDSPVYQLTRAGCRAMADLRARFPEAFASEGVLDVASDETEWARWEEAFRTGVPFRSPESEVRLVGREVASELCGLPCARGGWWFARSGIVYPSLLVRRLLEASGATLLENVSVRLRRTEDGWLALLPSGGVAAEASAALVCAAAGSPAAVGLADEDFGLSRLYGRISLLRDTDLVGLRTALTGDGYAVRLAEAGFAAVGATYEPNGPQLTREAAHAHNLSTFRKLLVREPEAIAAGFYEGERAVALDRMPLAGPMPSKEGVAGMRFRGRPSAGEIPCEPGLWGLFGLGSRGLSWGWLCAQTVADALSGAPARIPASLRAALHPARFMARALGK